MAEQSSNALIRASLRLGLHTKHPDVEVIVLDDNGGHVYEGCAYVVLVSRRTLFSGQPTSFCCGPFSRDRSKLLSETMSFSAVVDRVTLRRTKAGRWVTCGRTYRTMALARASHGYREVAGG